MHNQVIENLKKIGSALKNSFGEFMSDNCFQFSAAVSFYTLFSLAPIALIIVFVGRIFSSNMSFISDLEGSLTNFVGKESAEAVILLLNSINTESQNWVFLLIGLVVLLYSATNLFLQFKIAFNQIFRVRTRSGKAVIKELLDRMISFGIILFLGFILILSLVIETTLIFVFDAMKQTLGTEAVLNIQFIKNLSTFIVLFFGVYLFFKVLPDLTLHPFMLAVGSLVTSLLLILGKSGIGWIIGNSNLTDISGASTSVIILMLWVYYSSLILFFGIELVKSLSREFGFSMIPNKYSIKTKTVEFEYEKEDK